MEINTLLLPFLHMPDDLPTPGVKSNPKFKEIDESNPYVQLLLGTDFVTKETISANGLENVPEYQVLKTLSEADKLSQNDLESKVNHPLAPVAVKNLIGAELVVQTGDTYELSETAKTKL